MRFAVTASAVSDLIFVLRWFEAPKDERIYPSLRLIDTKEGPVPLSIFRKKSDAGRDDTNRPQLSPMRRDCRGCRKRFQENPQECLTSWVPCFIAIALTSIKKSDYLAIQEGSELFAYLEY